MVGSAGKAPSESYYDAPASIFSILDHVSERQIPDTVQEECSSRTTSSSSSQSSTTNRADSTGPRRVILPDTCSEDSASSVEEVERRLTRYRHWPAQIPTYPVTSKQLLPVYVYPKNYKRVHAKELVIHKGSALRDVVVFMGILTVIIVIGAVFTAVYFGFDW